MKRVDFFVPLSRSHPVAKVVILMCVLLAMAAYLSSLLRSDLAGMWRDIMLNTNIFGYNLVPLFMLLVCFGSVTFNGLERVRVNPSRIVERNARWTAFSAFVTALIPLISSSVTQPSSMHSLWLVAITYAQVAMELCAIGLLSLSLVYAGLSWGFVVPIVIVVFGLASWVFGITMPWLLNVMFFFLIPVTGLSSMLTDRILPFAVICVLLTWGSEALHARHDYLGC